MYPGKWFDDTTATAGSAVVTSQVAEWSCGDIGQAIQINGAGAGGTNLVTTIASVTPCWSFYTSGWQVVTLATNALTSVTNAHTYVSVLGFPVTQVVGNCGIALNMIDGKPADWVNPSQSYGPNGAEMINVTFVTYGTTSPAGGLCTQGGNGPYQLKADNVNLSYSTYGVIETTSNLNSVYQSSGNDFQEWRHNSFDQVKYPWIGYNSGQMHIEDWELTVQAGPQFLEIGNDAYDEPINWEIGTTECEIFGSPTLYGMRLEGTNHKLTNTSLTCSSSQVAAINANNVTCTGCSATNLQLGGYQNDLSFGDSLFPVVTDTGLGNHVVGAYTPSPLNGIPSSYWKTLIPQKGLHPIIAGGQTPDSIFDGNFTTQYNHLDLDFWPNDFSISSSFGPYSNLRIADSASPTGYEFAFTINTEVYSFSQLPYNTSTPFGISNPIIIGTGPCIVMAWFVRIVRAARIGSNSGRSMNSIIRRGVAVGLTVAACALIAGCDDSYLDQSSGRSQQPISSATLAEMDKLDTTPSSPTIIRTYKKEAELEIWKMKSNGEYALLKTYPMCRWSGQLGPKKREGDMQVPEGFYTIAPGQMNPTSHYYLSFNVGYPNAYDRAYGRTGGNVMVHGVCSSAGCFSMTDEQVADIYAIARKSFAGGQREIQLQSYPFHMTARIWPSSGSTPTSTSGKTSRTAPTISRSPRLNRQ